MLSGSATDHPHVLAALQADPEILDGLTPLLSGAHGGCARGLVLDCLRVRLAEGAPLRGAVISALADALRIAAPGGVDES